MNMIDDFMKDICDVLNILVPTISYDISHFQTKTMMAQCDLLSNTIYLDKCNEPSPDYFFSIAHELRHIWQLQDDEAFYFSLYKPIDLCSDTESYNSQIAEIDANAFAGLIMIEYFHLQPLFQGLSDSVKNKINKRMGEIAITL
jgi:Zn-dependent peptidase ImmA (M78 family)